MPVQCKLDSPEYELLLCFVMRWEWRKLHKFKLCNCKGTTRNLYNLIMSVGGKTILNLGLEEQHVKIWIGVKRDFLNTILYVRLQVAAAV